jgi:hypothetical protein
VAKSIHLDGPEWSITTRLEWYCTSPLAGRGRREGIHQGHDTWLSSQVRVMVNVYSGAEHV